MGSSSSKWLEQWLFGVLPPPISDAFGEVRWRLNPARRRRIERAASRCTTVEDWLAFGREHLPPGAAQQESEVAEFIDYLAQARPRRVCEIGTFFGGNYLVLSRMLALEQMIGVDLRVLHRPLLKALAPRGQRACFVNGSTRDPKTLTAVERLLGGERLDLLFIDGDHSPEGVRSDFLTYRHLVRDGGLIAFHDIQPDGRERGLESPADSGGVPTMWQLVRDRYPSREFIADRRNQLGYGIGVITYSSKVPYLKE